MAVGRTSPKGSHPLQVRTYCGHGIGDHFHTYPSIPHYSNNKVGSSLLLFLFPPSFVHQELILLPLKGCCGQGGRRGRRGEEPVAYK